jgi:hypothetical protein
MKTLLLCLLLALTTFASIAQNTDSIAYQNQRAKINGLLAQRALKFDQYTASLNTKTGIFGWQTKKDIKRSGEILMDIAKTDETIFKEIKVLLDFKTYQNTQVVAKLTQSQGSEDRSLNYMKTINKLREQNDQLKLDIAQQSSQYNQRQTIQIIIILVLILTSIFLFYQKSSINKA